MVLRARLYSPECVLGWDGFLADEGIEYCVGRENWWSVSSILLVPQLDVRRSMCSKQPTYEQGGLGLELQEARGDGCTIGERLGLESNSYRRRGGFGGARYEENARRSEGESRLSLIHI